MTDREASPLPLEGFVRLSSLIGGPTPVIPLSRTTIYRKILDGTFPSPVKIGKVSVWSVDAIRAWIKNPR